MVENPSHDRFHLRHQRQEAPQIDAHEEQLPVITHSLEAVGLEELKGEEPATVAPLGIRGKSSYGESFLHASLFELRQPLVEQSPRLTPPMVALRLETEKQGGAGR
jgi:hypothetical protein